MLIKIKDTSAAFIAAEWHNLSPLNWSMWEDTTDWWRTFHWGSGWTTILRSGTGLWRSNYVWIYMYIHWLFIFYLGLLSLDFDSISHPMMLITYVNEGKTAFYHFFSNISMPVVNVLYIALTGMKRFFIAHLQKTFTFYISTSYWYLIWCPNVDYASS